MIRTVFKFALIASLMTSDARATVLDLSHQAMKDVVKIARAINVVHPRLSEAKYLEYAVGIYRASVKYGIEPSVLIAITQQETAFRENLPEGAAGERGICQIIKSWLQNAKFKNEFKTAKLKDFNETGKSFMFAAWILKDLKARVTSGSLPYWSFYNANKFHNRFKYFLNVNKFVMKLKKKEHLFDDRAIAALELPETKAEPVETSKQSLIARAMNIISQATPRQATVDVSPATASIAPNLPNWNTQKVSAEEKPAPSHWIPDALKQIQLKNKAREASAPEHKGMLANLMRAAAELNILGTDPKKAIQD